MAPGAPVAPSLALSLAHTLARSTRHMRKVNPKKTETDKVAAAQAAHSSRRSPRQAQAQAALPLEVVLLTALFELGN